MSKHDCPACGEQAMEVFYTQENVPSNSCILLETKEDALAYPRGEIRLGFCDKCGFISNLAFDAKLTEYSGRYEETQAYSGTFNKFHHALAQRLIDDYDLHDKRVLEIGCGKGEFLQMVCELGKNRGIGFDPGFRPDRIDLADPDQVEFVRDFYSEKYASEIADFVCCKMTLEHIWETNDFIGSVRKAIGEQDSYIFFQIPETKRILQDCAFEDIYYEHCSYFTPGSLGGLFRRNGFDVLKIDIEYGDQYLTIEAKTAKGKPSGPLQIEENVSELAKLVADFRERVQRKQSYWKDVLSEASAKGETVALWGSGSKGVSFLSSLADDSLVDHVVDINPYRAGHFMSGTGHPIVSPDELTERKPDLVVVMNEVYQDEITKDLNDRGLFPRVLSL